MRYHELFEGKNTPCIVVDVQPQYTFSGAFKPDEPEYEEWDDETGEPIGEPIVNGESRAFVKYMMQFLNKQKGPILALCNAEDQKMTDDTLANIKAYWEHEGFKNWHNITWIDKGYGYLREVMDRGIDEKLIIKTIREMYQQRVTDSRDLFDGDGDQLVEFLGDEEAASAVMDGMSVNWLSVTELKKHAGYIMGGGREECLREVELLMSAFNLKHRQIEEFMY